MNPLRFAVLACVLAASFLTATPAHALYTIYQTGFEPTTFSLGDLAGQDGWLSTMPSNLVTVQNSVAKDGSQAVRIDRTNGVGLDGCYRFPGYDATGQVITVGIDAYLTDTGPASHWTVLATQVPGEFVHINVDVLGQIHLVNSGDPPDDHATGQYVTRGQWNRFEQVIDFNTRTASIFYNGVSLWTDPFGGTSNLINFEGFYGQNSGTGDIGYFDNFSMRSNVPEPSSLGILISGLAAFLLVCGRRRSRAT